MKFLKNVLSTMVGMFVFSIIFFLGIIIIGVAVGGDSPEVAVESNSVIELNLGEISKDYGGKYKDGLYSIFSDDDGIGLTDVIRAIKEAKTDENIKGISIKSNYSKLGIAQYKELRNALEDFKTSGKFVYAYSEVYFQRDYYLNSVADKIYLNPVGYLDFKGLSSEILFFKDFQDKTGFKMDVIRHGKYKSAVEPFLDNKMSPANREQLTALLNSIWENIVADISKSRKISVEELNKVAEGLLARTPEMAKSSKLIDIIAQEDEYIADLKKKLEVKPEDDLNKVSISNYTIKSMASAITTTAENEIAVIYAQGEIRGGEGDVDYVGEVSIGRSLAEARKNDKIKAVVLRVDSPGGSALTSELIWREVKITREKKPVVVSMGNLAASGGYYIACGANKIFAENTTITGSIGVFGVLPNVTVLAKKIGINAEQIKTHKNAITYSPFVPLDDKSRGFITEGIERIYSTFLSHVAEGRNMTVSQVDNVAQGRVWTGAEALKLGLIDKIGGLNDAIAEAANIAKIKEYSTQNYPVYEKDISELFGKIPFSKSRTEIIKEEIGEENYKILTELKQLQSHQGIQALLPYRIIIE